MKKNEMRSLSSLQQKLMIFDECRRSFTEVKCRILNLLFSRNFPRKFPIFFENQKKTSIQKLKIFLSKTSSSIPKKKTACLQRRKQTKIVQTKQLWNAIKEEYAILKFGKFLEHLQQEFPMSSNISNQQAKFFQSQKLEDQ